MCICRLVTSLCVIPVVCFLPFSGTRAHTESMRVSEVAWDVLDGGGRLMCSDSYSLGGSLDQTTPGISVSTHRIMSGGYWAGVDTLPACAAYACGDCNGDGRVTIADATYLVAYIYRGGPGPLGQADVNLDGRVTIADATYLVAFIYRGGPPPCQPPVTVPAREKRRAER